MDLGAGNPWKTLEESLPETLAPALLLDRKGCLAAVNLARARLQPGESGILGEFLSSLAVPGDRETVDQAVRDCHRTGRPTQARTSWDRDFPKGEDPEVALLFCPLGEWTVALIERRDQMADLQATLDRRGELLSIHCEITSIANTESDVETAIECVLRRIARFNGWQFGLAFLRDDEDPDLLVPVTTAYSEKENQIDAFESLTRQSSWRVGEGLPGKVAESGQPILTKDIQKETAPPLASLAQDLGLVSAFTFPILVHAEVVGVLQFFSLEPLRNEHAIELNSLAAVGLHLGRVIERARSRRARQKSEEHLRLMTRKLSDAVWIYHPRTRRVTYANPALVDIWEIPQEQLLADGEIWLEGLLEADRPRARRALDDLRQGKVMNEELRLSSRSGNHRWIRLRCFPISDDEGSLNSIAATAEDISQDMASRAARALLEKQLRQVAEDERQKIARDLHDDLGGLLSAISLRVETLRTWVKDHDPSRLDAIETLARMAGEAIATTRRLTRGLAPVGDDPQDLQIALQELVNGVNDGQQIECRLEAGEITNDPDSQTANQLFRIAHEAVTNAVKHSKGHLIIVRLRQDRGDLILSIIDDGCGLYGTATSGGTGGHGLGTMQYRAQEIGADFTSEPGPDGKGLQIRCRPPASALATPCR